MQEKFDDIDFKILSELRKDCKRHISDIAKKLKMHPNTVLFRIKKLEKDGIILAYNAEVDYHKLGYDLHVLITIILPRGRVGDIEQLKKLSDIPEIQALYACTGSYDVVALAYVKNSEDLSRVLREIEDCKAVLRTDTHLMLYAYKSPYQYNPLKSKIEKKTRKK